MLYRVAIRSDRPSACPLPAWHWVSPPLGSRNTLVQWLLWYRTLPRERMCVFSAGVRETLDTQLRYANQGYDAAAVSATQFVPATSRPACGCVSERAEALSAVASVAPAPRPPVPALPTLRARPPSLLLSGPVDQRREALERGAGGDHDMPYRFSLPSSAAALVSWVKLLARMQQGDFQADVAAAGEAEHWGSILRAASPLLTPA
jgi:hypothetical protein